MTEILEEEEQWDMLDAELEDVMEVERARNRRKYELKLARQARDSEEPDAGTT